MAIVEQPVDDRISIRAVLKDWGRRTLAVLTFVAGRLAFAAATLLIIIFLSFFGLDMARGTAFFPALKNGAVATGSYLGRLVSGDLGTAFAAGFGTRRMDISEIVAAVVPRSVGLLAVSLGIAIVLGIILGVLAARRRDSIRALPIIFLSLIGISLPSFLAALLLQIAAVSYTRYFGRALLPVGGFGWDAHLILPALVLAARPIAQITRVTSVTVTNVLKQDYVRTAQSKGLRGYIIWLRHIAPNAAIPILTTIGTSVRFSLSSLPVVELYFGWPGIGQTLIRAIARRDDLLTVALALTLGLIFIGINFLLEASYRLIDPQLREAATRTAKQGGGWKDALSALAGMFDGVRELPVLRRWLSAKTDADREYEARLKNSLIAHGATEGKERLDAGIRRERAKTWLRGTLGNFPFLIGAILLAGLLAIYVAGPALSPNNPYTTKGLDKIGGVIQVPPFAPSADYPWGSDALGRDMMSLVLSGAQQTLTLVALVMLARLAVGFVLGTLAGWQQDKPLDRLIMATGEVFSALPTLIFSMLLVLALGIRRGIWVFVVALCFVGWGEMMQFIRSEVIVLRQKLYVESAVASGARLSGIIVRHLLPNLLPSLIALGALEMGAVAMLLGELGFIGIFIGGGAFAEVSIGGPPYHYSDIPEWGALLSNVRTYARGYPWTAIYPSLAFFTVILAFNLFGEGLRRLVQDIGLSFNKLVNRYTVLAAIVLIWELSWVQGNTGSIAFYKQQARAFDRGKAMTELAALTDPALTGRAVGTPGADIAADYIAQKFKEYGLQPGGKKSTYFFDVKRDFFQLTETPQLSFNGQPLVYRRDFAEIPSNLFNGSEPKTGELVVLGAGEQVFVGTSFTGQQFPRQIVTLDFSNDAVLLLNNDAFLPNMLRQGTFYLTENPDVLRHRDSLSAYSPNAPSYDPMQGSPFFFVTEAAADKMLASTGLTLADLRREQAQLAPDDVKVWRTGVTISDSLVGEVRHKVPARHVIGYLPGADTNLDDKLIVVLAQYDGLGVDETGTLYPSANDSASSVAVMLEMLRSWKESGYQPKKTIIFVAYVGEGFDYGQFPRRTPDVERFISGKFGFATAFTPEAFVFLRGLGAGSGKNLELAAGGNLRLAQLFERAADQMGVSTQRANEDFSLDVIFGGTSNVVTSDAPTISLNWAGFEETIGTPDDTPAAIDPAKLEKSGRALSLALLIMGREVNY